MLRSVALWMGERFPMWVSVPLAIALAGAARREPTGPGLPALAALTWLLLLGARATDDVADLERDRARAPRRALPSGRASARAVSLAAATSWGAALAGSWLLSPAAGLLVLGYLAAVLASYAARARLPAAFAPAVVDLAYPVTVLLASVRDGDASSEAAWLALFVWTAAIGHDLAHGIEESIARPGPVGSELTPVTRARWGARLFLASLAAAAAAARVRPDPAFALAVVAGAAWCGPLLWRLRRDPSPQHARALRVPGFVYFTAPLAARTLWNAVA